MSRPAPAAPIPVRWAAFGALSRLIALALPPRQPAVLVLSLPRSGSSWVGEVLGNATDALYLREPITQTRLALGRRDTLAPVAGPAPDPVVLSAAHTVFAAWPAFSRNIVRIPEQWGLRQRRRRRLVVKEVNPRAAPLLLPRFRPRLIFLVRHPAAVALSFQRRGWGLAGVEALGRQHAAVLKEAYAVIHNYPDCRVVTYEDLCLDPLEQFRAMFDFAGLAWNDHIVRFIEHSTSGGDRSDPYGTSRNSRAMAYAWQGEISAADLAQLRRSFEDDALPWYQSPEDWQIVVHH